MNRDKYTSDKFFIELMNSPVPNLIQDFVFNLIYRSTIRFDKFTLKYYGIEVLDEDYDPNDLIWDEVYDFTHEELTQQELQYYVDYIKLLFKKYDYNGKHYIKADEYCEPIESHFSYMSGLKGTDDEILWRYVWDVSKLELHEMAENKLIHDTANELILKR